MINVYILIWKGRSYMLNLKKIGIVLIIVVMMIFITKTVYATDTNQEFQNILDDSLGNKTNNTVNNSSINNLLNSTNTNTNKNTSSIYNNTNLPKAGSSDGIAIIAVALVFGVSAIYAYRKIRDYNIK